MNPYEYPEKRCSALVNCTAMLGLESKYNAYGKYKRMKNCIKKNKRKWLYPKSDRN